LFSSPLPVRARGGYVGCARCGRGAVHPDRGPLAVLAGLPGLGFGGRLVLSHDTVWGWRGRELKLPAETLARWKPTYVLREILPKLRAAGVAEEKLQAMLVENPRRYFAKAGTTSC